MKGIILAGGSGTRLYPATFSISKQLIPVYDKPMIYYPVSILMTMGITEILIISTPEDLPLFEKLFGTGQQIGLKFSYTAQEKPEGIAQAFLLGEEFIGKDQVTLILGDNIFYGHGLPELLISSSKENQGATIFGHYVNDPERYGVAEFDSEGKVISLEEKPKQPKSKYAVTGLYIYDNKVVEYAKSLKPSARGELEITDLNKVYLNNDNLKIELLGRGIAWLDTGTHESLLEASNFISIIEQRQGLKIACLEEIAYRQGLISKEQVATLAAPIAKNGYGQYLLELIKYKEN
ncbi:MAG: glucose-1-phosphate thymidylyltransferase RfbA [Halobacteriovoraceae bacterium]|nr:glucose-1-phosphate thymidylyltransferase RfbA [Halobacteriovoraceae bacterium]